MKEADDVARALKVHLQILDGRGPNDFDKAFSAMTREWAGGLFVLPSPMLSNERKPIVDFAAKESCRRYPDNRYAGSGELMFYAANFANQFHRVSVYVDKIFKGAKPVDLPVEQPTKFYFIINLTTAKHIGLTTPPNVLASADRVIK